MSLEAFQTEMNLEASTRIVDGEDKEERRGQRRPVGAKTRRHKLDDLHRRMSWSERTQRSNSQVCPFSRLLYTILGASEAE